jgi:hypothetical protein
MPDVSGGWPPQLSPLQMRKVRKAGGRVARPRRGDAVSQPEVMQSSIACRKDGGVRVAMRSTAFTSA